MLGGGQTVRFAVVDLVLLDPIADALVVDAQVLADPGDGHPRQDQADSFSPKVGRVPSVCLGHVDRPVRSIMLLDRLCPPKRGNSKAVVSEGRSPTEIARIYGVSRSWIYRLLDRYQQGGLEAIQPRSRRPRSCPHQLSPEVRDEILELRDHLCAAGFDAGPQTIATHLAKHLDQVPSPATIWRILKRC